MQTKWIVFLATVYIFGIVFGGLIEETYVGSTEASTLDKVIHIETFHIAGLTIPRPSLEWLESLGKMLLWDFAFFRNADGSANEWALVKWLVFIPVSLGLIVSFVTTFVPIILQGIRAVRFW